MENYKRTMELIDTAQNSAGRSSEQFAKYQDTIENKLNKLKNTWEQFRVNLIDEKVIKKGIDLLNNFLSKFSNMNLKKLGITSLGAILFGGNFLKTFVKDTQGLVNAAGELGTKVIDKFRSIITKQPTKIQLEADISTAQANLQTIEEERKQLSSQPINLKIQGATQAITSLGQLHERLVTVGIDFSNSSLAIDDLIEALQRDGIQFNQEDIDLQKLLETLQQYNQKTIEASNANDTLQTKTKQLNRSLEITNSIKSMGMTLGNALGTAITMGFSGGFSGEEIAKTIETQIISSGITNTLTKLFSGDFVGAGITAGITLITTLGVEIYKEVNEEQKQRKKAAEQTKIYSTEVGRARMAVEALTKAEEELGQELEEGLENAEEQKNKLNNLEDANKSLEEYRNQLLLTDDEQEEYIKLQNDLAEQFPEMIDHYDAQGNAVLKIAGAWDQAIDAQRKYYIEAQQDALSSQIGYDVVEYEKSFAELKYAKELDQIFNNEEIKSIFPIFFKAMRQASNRDDIGWDTKINKDDINNLFGYDLDFDKMSDDIKREYQDWIAPAVYAGNPVQMEELKDSFIEQKRKLNPQAEYLKEKFWGSQLGLAKQIQDWSKEEEEAFIYILKETEYYDKIIAEKGETFAEQFEAYIKDDTNGKTDIISMFEQISENYEKLNINNIEQLNESVEKQKENIKNTIKDFYELSIMSTPLLLKSSENVQEVMKEVALQMSIGNKDIDQLLKEFQETQPNLYKDGKVIEGKEEEASKKFADYLKEEYAKDKEVKEWIEQIEDEQIEKIDQFYEYIDKHSEMNEQQIREYAKEIFNTKEEEPILQGILGLRKDQFSEYEKQIERIYDFAEKLHGKSYHAEGTIPGMPSTDYIKDTYTDTFKIIQSWAIEEWSPGALKTFTDIMNDIGEKSGKAFIDSINYFLDDGLGLTPDQLSQILNFNWKGVDILNISEMEAQFKIEFAELGDKLEPAWQQMLQTMINFGYVDLSFNDEKIKTLTDNAYNKIEKQLSSLSGITSILTNQLTNGFIDFSDSRQLEKACEELGLTASNYISQSLNGDYLFDTNKFYQDAIQQLQTQGQLEVEQIKEKLNEEVRELEIEEALLDSNTEKLKEIENQIDAKADYLRLCKNEYKIMKAMGEVAEDIDVDSADFDISHVKISDSVDKETRKTEIEKQIKKYKDQLAQLEPGETLYNNITGGSSAAINEFKRKWQKAIDDYNESLKQEEETSEDAAEATEDLTDAMEDQTDAAKELEEAQENLKKAQEAYTEAQEKLSEAYEDLADKEEKAKEAQEALNEAMYGTGSRRKSTLDGMYNYEQQLDVIDSELESIKTNLEHIGPNDNIAELVNSYGQNVRTKKANLLKQKGVYEDNLDIVLGNLSQYSSYYTLQNGRLLADVAALNAASMNDEIKNEIENQIKMYNDSAKKISDIDKQIKQIEQEFLDFRKTYRDKYISLQEKVISTMKEEAQKELQTQQEKYAAMEEADNEYTNALEEAIQKQRELRSQANEWEDLATKEKKLSLLQRDTSGANQKEIMKQEQDIEKSRQNLLDKGIDNIIKNLKNLYTEQKKTRDAEIKYQQAVLNNATYIEEANAVINSWQTADDLIGWFTEHSQEVWNMTDEQLEKYTEDLEDMFNAREIYMNTSAEDFINMLNIQEEEIDDVVSNTAEWLTLESSRSLEEVMKKVDEAISKAKKDLNTTLDDVKKAKDTIKSAIEEVAKALSNLENAIKAVNAAGGNVENSSNSSSSSSNSSTETSSSNSSGGSSNGNFSYSSAAASLNANDSYWMSPEDFRRTGKSADELASRIVKAAGGADYEYKQYVENDGTFHIVKNMNGVDDYGNTAWIVHPNKYAKGGLVDYTGPAWVDGTPAQPEAFLSAKDTQMISNFTDVLRSLYTSIGFSNSQQVNPSIGDTHIEVHINIENVASDYDVDSAVERVKQDIIDAANQTGRNVILYQ